MSSVDAVQHGGCTALVYEDKAGKFRFRLKAGNGEISAVGEAYDTQASAKEGCAAVQRAADGATVVEADS
jgi:uncharacterized protein YegP (UPF0339 family)